MCDNIESGTNAPENAKEACQQIQEKKAELAAMVEIETDEGWLGTVRDMTPYGFLSNLSEDLLDSNQNISQTMTNLIKVSQTALSGSENDSRCSNVAVSNNSNEVNIDPGQCLADFTRTLEEHDPPYTGEEMNRMLATVTPIIMGNIQIGSIDQSIKEKNMQACQINAAQTALQEQDASLDNEALQSVLSDLEGSGSINTSSDVCNSVDVSQTACSYVKSSQCCSNILNSRKQNAVNLTCVHGSIDEINQAQETENVQQCALTNSQKSEERQAEATVNETSASVAGTAKPASKMYLVIIAVVCLIVCGVIGYFYISSDRPLPPQPMRTGY